MASGITQAQFQELGDTSNTFLFITCISYGVLCAQAYEYFLAFHEDSRLLKAATSVVMFLETLHFAVTIDTIYHFTVVVADNPQVVLNITWDSGAIILVDTLVVLIVQFYYIRRIWILSKRSRALVVILATLVGIRCALELVVVAYLYLPATHNFVAFRNNRVTFIIYCCWMSFGALGDVLMAACVGTLLIRRRTGFRSTDTLLRKIMALSINSGAMTAAVAVTSLVTFLVLGSRNIVNNGLLVFASGLYANSFFGMLNARSLFRKIDANNGRRVNATPLVFGDAAGTNTSSGFKMSEMSRSEMSRSEISKQELSRPDSEI